MMVGNTFDSWQKDEFFSAAEDVQESADILESAYRTWFSAKRDGISLNDLEELSRELQTSLGTAKWQLDEFGKAVRSSYGNQCDRISMARHQQFIVAIESQISRAENALKRSLTEEGKEQFRWVNLNEDERDDLAMFLSGFSETPSKSTTDETTSDSRSSERENTCKKQELDFGACSTSYSEGSNIQRKGLYSSRDDIVINIERAHVNGGSDRTRTVKRAQSLSNFGSLSISMPGDVDETQTLIQEVEDTPKDRGSRLSKLLNFRVTNYISQLIRHSSGLNNKIQFSRRLQSSPSIRIAIILVGSFFLLAPYLLR